jgi:hypothetical protein
MSRNVYMRTKYMDNAEWEHFKYFGAGRPGDLPHETIVPSRISAQSFGSIKKR